MKFVATNSYIPTKEQNLIQVERRGDGFVVVEWDGIDLGGD